MAEERSRSSSARRKLGWEDYQAFPEEGTRYEILDGKLAVTPTPFILHQRVSRNLELLLYNHISAYNLGEVLNAPVTVVLDEHTILEPDLVFVSTERAHLIGEKAIAGAPDLVIEILSPSTARRDRTVKLRLYGRFGVPHYWIVDPSARELFAFERTPSSRAFGPARVLRGNEAVEMSVPKGFRLELGKVWPAR